MRPHSAKPPAPRENLKEPDSYTVQPQPVAPTSSVINETLDTVGATVGWFPGPIGSALGAAIGAGIFADKL